MNTINSTMNQKSESRAKAYFILPVDFSSELVEEAACSMDRVAENYQVVLVVPDEDTFCISGLLLHADMIVKRDFAEKPAIGDVCIFLAASKDLVAKSALCLRIGFESNLAADFIENGNSVFMIKEKNYLTCREPKAYVRKIEKYEKDLAEYGVAFNTLPIKAKAVNTAGRGESKRRIITAADIKQAENNGTLSVSVNDIVTAVAKETAEKLNVEIIYR